MSQNPSTPQPDNLPEVQYFEHKVIDEFAHKLQGLSAHNLEQLKFAINPLSKEQYVLKMQDFIRFKVPDGLLNISALAAKNSDLMISPILKHYMAHENAVIAQIKKLSVNYPKPNETVMKVIEQQSKLLEALSKANMMWKDLQSPVVIDGMITVPKVFVPQLNMPTAVANWAREYTSMYLRIAEELQRERETLEAMFKAVKSSPAYEDLELLLSELKSVSELSKKVHHRLCLIEKLSSNREFLVTSFIDEMTAELRLDHGRLDDALVMIGETPVRELVGATTQASRTWYRLKLIAKRLKRIDGDIGSLFQYALD